MGWNLTDDQSIHRSIDRCLPLAYHYRQRLSTLRPYLLMILAVIVEKDRRVVVFDGGFDC